MSLIPANSPPPSTNGAAPASTALAEMIRQRPERLVENLTTSLREVAAGALFLPATVNDEQYENSYVCSPYTQFVHYALDELRWIESASLRTALRAAICSLAPLLRAGQLNRAALVNNWLFSTNLYPQADDAQINELVDVAEVAFLRWAVAFRTLNRRTDPRWIDLLQRRGYRAVPCRQIYFQDPSQHSLWRLPSVRRDEKLLARSEYEVVGPARIAPHAARAAHLYDLLYIRKHSRWNPHYTPRFIRLLMETGLLAWRGLMRNGRLDGVVGFYQVGNAMAAPVLGYDTSLPQELGLYRMLSLLLLREARDRTLLLHASAGAADFKRARGGEPETEYLLVRTDHLPLRQRAAWTLLENILDRVAQPLLKTWRL